MTDKLWRAAGFTTIVAILAVVAFFLALALSPYAARAGDYGEYHGQGSWAERAMNEGVRIRGKPQYQPGGDYQPSYGYSYQSDSYYPRRSHTIRVHKHSHPHHRERGYSRVTHTHAVTHTHYYRPRYVHPRYTRTYYHWRPYRPRPHWTRWQERAAPRYAWVRVPIYSRDGHPIPERYRWDPDVRAAWERSYYRDERRHYDADLIRRGYLGQERRPSRFSDCKPIVKHYGETRAREDEAMKVGRLGWSAAVALEYGLKYADLRHAKREESWERCYPAGHKEEGLEKLADTVAKAFTGRDAWKMKCVVVATPCAPPMKKTKLCDKMKDCPEADAERERDDDEDHRRYREDDEDDLGPNVGPPRRW